MVRTLVNRGLIDSAELEEAFRAVPRHVFLPGMALDKVYSPGEAIPTHFEGGVPVSSSSAPDIMAIMIRQLELEPGDRVLEIGSGTGYNAAVLAHMAGPAGQVVSVDIDPSIVGQADQHLADLAKQVPIEHLAEIDLLAADGWLGDEEHSPFDRIEATVGVWDLSHKWLSQLREGGVLLVPLWLRCGIQASIAFHRRGTHLVGAQPQRCGFMRLRGEHAGPDAYVNLDSWTACMEAPSDRDVEALGRLLRTEPEARPAPLLRDGWFTAVAFHDSLALRLFALDDWRHEANGLFDPSTPDLALVDRGMLLSFGAGRCAERLSLLLEEQSPIDLSALRVEAVPRDEPVRCDRAIVLRRPEFSYVITSAA